MKTNELQMFVELWKTLILFFLELFLLFFWSLFGHSLDKNYYLCTNKQALIR